MESFDELQAAWQGTPPPASLPTGPQVAALARRARWRLVGKLVVLTALLTGTLAFITYGAWTWTFAYPTTKLGMLLVLLAVAAAIAANSRLLRLLLGRTDPSSDARAYLVQLRQYQARQRVMQTTGMRIYFSLLSVGMTLYVYEFLMRNWVFGVVTYALTAGWFAFSWFYLGPRAIRRQEQAIAELIRHTEALAGQLAE